MTGNSQKRATRWAEAALVLRRPIAFALPLSCGVLVLYKPAPPLAGDPLPSHPSHDEQLLVLHPSSQPLEPAGSCRLAAVIAGLNSLHSQVECFRARLWCC